MYCRPLRMTASAHEQTVGFGCQEAAHLVQAIVAAGWGSISRSTPAPVNRRRSKRPSCTRSNARRRVARDLRRSRPERPIRVDNMREEIGS